MPGDACVRQQVQPGDVAQRQTQVRQALQRCQQRPRVDRQHLAVIEQRDERLRLPRHGVARAEALHQPEHVAVLGGDDVRTDVDDVARGCIDVARRAAAEMVGGLEHRDPQTLVGQRDGAGQSRDAATDDKHVRARRPSFAGWRLRHRWKLRGIPLRGCAGEGTVAPAVARLVPCRCTTRAIRLLSSCWFP